MSVTAFFIYGFAFVAALCALAIVVILGYLLCAATAAKIRHHLCERLDE